jgi:type II secretory pathway pseudopilin PulG
MNKRGQIWVETVIYTLMGLVILGILLSVITPKINQMKDRTVIMQTIDSLNAINNEIQETLSATGNKRQVLIYISKGKYTIDPKNETISFALRSLSYMYGQPGQVIEEGPISALTLDVKDKYDIYLYLNYSDYNITYDGKDIKKELTPAPSPYKLLIENNGGPDKNLNIKLL